MTRTIIFLFGFCFCMCNLIGQQTITKTIEHDGMNRSYIIYIPDTYSSSDTVPLLLNFHGYTSNANEQMVYGDFRSIADENGFIVVHPEGSLFNGATHWNVGGFTIGSTVDDVDFTDKMIDHIASDYSIDFNRIYATGMSNGGFMSFLLACQLSNKIAAIASVTGSMTPSTYTNCDPQHPTPVLYIHGTSDSVVPYDGALWTRQVEDVISYWSSYNVCDEDALEEDIPDINPSDGSTVQKFSFLNGDLGSEVVHYKVLNGDHTWPGTIINFPGTNYDINASQVIWDFFSRYDINGLIDTETSITEIKDFKIQIFPNPSTGIYSIEIDENITNVNFTILDLNGISVQRGTFTSKESQLDITDLPQGFYFLQVGSSRYRLAKI